MVSLAATFAAGVSYAEAATDVEAILARLEQLEGRITELEAELEQSRAEIRAVRSGSGSGGSATAGGDFAVSTGAAGAGGAGGTASTGATGGAAAGGSGVTASIAPETRLGQEAFINRDTLPTLKERSFEISQEFAYLRNQGFIQSERALSSVTTLRYGIRRGMEVAVRVPAFYVRRVTTAVSSSGTASTIVTNNSGIGDAELNFSYVALDQRQRRPGMSLSAAVILPTGANPYFFPASYTAGAPPFDGTIGFQSTSHWGLRAGAQFFKNADPLVLFWGGQVEYLLDKRTGGHTVSRGLRFALNAGFSIALSQYTTVANSLQYNYEGMMTVDGVLVGGTNSEAVTNRLVLIQRVGDGAYIEPSVTIGLTDNAGDVQFGLGFRKQW